MAELDSSVFNHPATAFHVIPYFAHTHIDLPPLNELLDISNHCLQELKDSEVSDPDEEAGDGFDEGSMDNHAQPFIQVPYQSHCLDTPICAIFGTTLHT